MLLKMHVILFCCHSGRTIHLLLKFIYLNLQPVNLFPSNELGFHDVFGNVWQWQEDHFNGLSTDFHWFYDDFSSPCYDGKHNMILVRTDNIKHNILERFNIFRGGIANKSYHLIIYCVVMSLLY